MDRQTRPGHSQFFTLRLWLEEVGDGGEWRGQVHHVTSGEARYFRDWETLVAHLVEMLGPSIQDSPSDNRPSG